jgi:hypothetical protein
VSHVQWSDQTRKESNPSSDTNTNTIWVLLIVYAIMAFFVPIYIYRTMRRSTQILETLKEIKSCLVHRETPAAPNRKPPVAPAAPMLSETGVFDLSAFEKLGDKQIFEN